MPDSLGGYIDSYRNTAEHNQTLFQEFQNQTNQIGWLKKHRDSIEKNNWGTGERAFHFMWMLILRDLSSRFSPITCLEIGVFKGQVISLWALIAKQAGLNVLISAISPLEGNLPVKRNLLVRILSKLLRPKHRAFIASGNLYPIINYMEVIAEVFACSDVDLGSVKLMKGLSNDRTILGAMAGKKFSVVYIDGDHTYEGCLFDIQHYASMVEVGGYLVMDDAAFDLPGEGYFKGYQSVSLACKSIPDNFSNILNIGHNRIYKRIAD